MMTGGCGAGAVARGGRWAVGFAKWAWFRSMGQVWNEGCGQQIALVFVSLNPQIVYTSSMLAEDWMYFSVSGTSGASVPQERNLQYIMDCCPTQAPRAGRTIS